jgi:uncharacterized membrane protein YtjA (UPF0391 family)
MCHRSAHRHNTEAISTQHPHCGIQRSCEGSIMLKWALILGIVAIIAGALGFTGIAGAAAGIAKFLFFLFLAIVAVLLILGFFVGKKVTGD